MSNSPEQPARELSEHGEPSDFIPSNAAEQQARDDIMRVLSDFQLGLEAVKSLHAQRESLQLELVQRRAELADRDQRLEQQKQEFEAAVTRFQDQVRALEIARDEHGARERSLSERAAKLEQNAKAHDELISAADADLAKAREVLERRAKELAQLADRLEKQGRELAESRAQLAAREAEVVKLRAELDLNTTANRQTQKASSTLAGEADQLRREISMLKDLADEYESLWHHERRNGADLHVRLRELCEQAQQGRAELIREVAQRTSTLAELETDLAAMKGRLQSELAQRDDLVRKAEEAGSAQREAERAAAMRAKQFEEASATLAATRAEASALREQLSQSRRAPKPRADGFVARRRERLRKYRAAVRKQVLKVRKASDAIGKRMEQVDQLLAQRAEVAAARNRVLEAERRLQKGKAKSRAAVVSLCAVAVIGLLGGLSWAGAREFAPATYVAEASIKADGRGRELNEAELQEWAKFHMDLLADPMFQESAADRFQRQGLTSLATPASVTALINGSISADEVNPGEIRLFLRGMGQEQTRRTLEAFTASLASFANAAQQRRIDGGATSPTPARVDDRPVDRSQVFYALGMMVSGAIFVGGLALWVWKKLSRAKTSFEHDAQVAALLDDARWSDLTPR